MQPGRNDPCPCGSGKKYKKCCIPKYDNPVATAAPQHKHSLFDSKIDSDAFHSFLANMWAPEKLQQMNDDEIVDKLAELHIPMTKEQFIADAASCYSSDEVRVMWEQRYAYEIDGYDADFPYCAIMELHRRWLPEHVHYEMIEDMLQDMFNDSAVEYSVPHLHKVWTLLRDHIIVPLNIRSFQELYDRFPGEYDLESIWFEEEGEFVEECKKLEDPERQEQAFGLLIDVYQEIPKHLPESDSLNLLNCRKAVCEFHYYAGHYAQGEQGYEKLLEEYPTWVWGYVSWGDIFSRFGPANLYSPERAAELYQRGLEHCTDPDDVSVLEQRLEAL